MVIHLALFLARFAPRSMKPWLIGIAIGRKPEQLEFRAGKWRLPLTPEEEADQREFLKSFDQQLAELERKASTAQTSTTEPSSSQPDDEA